MLKIAVAEIVLSFGICIFAYIEALHNLFATWPFLIVSAGLHVVTVLALYYKEDLRRDKPWKYIALLVMILSMAL